MFLTSRSFSAPAHGGLLFLVAAVFAAGMTIGATVGSGVTGRTAANERPEPQAVSFPAKPLEPAAVHAGYPAEVLRVLDGDTFEARVRVWLGTDITTRVRLRGVDAPEMKARCEDERLKAVAAKDSLAAMLAQGGIALSNVGQDKYGGRVDADVSTRAVASVSDAMLEKGLARRYDGGRRQGWCG
jgi:endonuclease YncB( thermonuclease family)